MTLAADIKQKAIELGFDLVGITDAAPIETKHVELLADWLAAGYAGEMDYMQRNFEQRVNPGVLLENAQSVIVVGLNYKPPSEKSSDAAVPMGRVANYARYEDYHPFIKKRLRELTIYISSIVGNGFSFKICVDSAPLLERAFAVRAGLGFIGKNHMLINPKFGPQILLGEVITSLKLNADRPIAGNCSECSKCLAACPTGALRKDGRLDANKCISYLTTEYKGLVGRDLAEKMGDRLFGCDECVLACPYQENAPVCKNKQFKFCDDRARLSLQDVLNLSEELFEAKFSGSAMMRLGLEGLKRNARICLANTNGSCRH